MAILKQLTNHIFYTSPDPEFDQPVLAAVVGEKRVLMIDGGISVAHSRLFNAALQKKINRSVDFVALTHWHWDHVFGLAGLEAVLIGHRNTAVNLSRLKSYTWDDSALSKRVETGEEVGFCAQCIRKVYPGDRDINIKFPDIYFDRSLTINLGGITCELYHVSADHTDDSIMIHISEEKVLFLGDALGPNPYTQHPFYTGTKVLALLELIRSLAPDWYVESHSNPVGETEFWDYNEILEVTAKLVLEGARDKNHLVEKLKEKMGDRLPEDYMEVAEQFANGLTI